MSTNVQEYFGVAKTKGDIGIEIEMEGVDLINPDDIPKAVSKNWRVDFDGSLRGEAYEYVLNKPIDIKEVKECVSILMEGFESAGSSLRPSVRCGVHVHVNVQEMNIVELATFITCYLTIEELLLTFCEPSRKGNHFCLRAKDAEFLIYSLENAFRRHNFNFNDDIRYSALNVLSLLKYGSLEFRALETPKDLNKVILWAEILYKIKQSSKTFSSPKAVVEAMSQEGGKEFINHLLGDFSKSFLLDDVDRLIVEGVRNAQLLAYSCDWSNKDFLKKKRNR